MFALRRAKRGRWVWRNWLRVVSGGDGGGVGRVRSLLHAATAAGPVAVVEVEAFALEDEGAYAILFILLVLALRREV